MDCGWNGASRRPRIDGPVLVTGGCGFIGAHVVAALEAGGCPEVVVLDNEAAGNRSALSGLGARFHVGDVRDPEALDAVMPGCTAVIHLAACPDVAGALADPLASMDVNVAGTLAVLEAARRHGVRRVLAASSGGTVLGAAQPPVREDVAPAPRSLLGASKLAMEGYLGAYAASFGMTACVLRLANVYGPGCGHKNSVVAGFLRAAHTGNPLTLRGDGTQARDFVYVEDVAEGVVQAAGARASGIYQLGSGQPTSINDLIGMIADVSGRRTLDVRREAPWPGEVHRTYCDISRAAADFGFAPRTPLASGLRRTLAWLRAAEDRAQDPRAACIQGLRFQSRQRLTIDAGHRPAYGSPSFRASRRL